MRGRTPFSARWAYARVLPAVVPPPLFAASVYTVVDHITVFYNPFGAFPYPSGNLACASQDGARLVSAGMPK